MCLGIPVRVVSLNEDEPRFGHVETGGGLLEVDLSLIEDLKVGDFVLVHAGFAIARIEPQEAEKSLSAWEELLSHGNDDS